MEQDSLVVRGVVDDPVLDDHHWILLCTLGCWPLPTRSSRLEALRSDDPPRVELATLRRTQLSPNDGKGLRESASELTRAHVGTDERVPRAGVARDEHAGLAVRWIGGVGVPTSHREVGE